MTIDKHVGHLVGKSAPERRWKRREEPAVHPCTSFAISPHRSYLEDLSQRLPFASRTIASRRAVSAAATFLPSVVIR